MLPKPLVQMSLPPPAHADAIRLHFDCKSGIFDGSVQLPLLPVYHSLSLTVVARKGAPHPPTCV